MVAPHTPVPLLSLLSLCSLSLFLSFYHCSIGVVLLYALIMFRLQHETAVKVKSAITDSEGEERAAEEMGKVTDVGADTAVVDMMWAHC